MGRTRKQIMASLPKARRARINERAASRSGRGLAPIDPAQPGAVNLGIKPCSRSNVRPIFISQPCAGGRHTGTRVKLRAYCV